MSWEHEPPPTLLEMAGIEMAARSERAILTLGIRARSRAVLRVMLTGDQRWTVQGIAKRTGLPRTTAREVLVRMVEQGNVTQKGRQFCLTPSGRGLLLRVERETFQVVVGARTGYSLRLIQHFRDLPTANPTAEAATISFPKLIY